MKRSGGQHRMLISRPTMATAFQRRPTSDPCSVMRGQFRRKANEEAQHATTCSINVGRSKTGENSQPSVVWYASTEPLFQHHVEFARLPDIHHALGLFGHQTSSGGQHIVGFLQQYADQNAPRRHPPMQQRNDRFLVMAYGKSDMSACSVQRAETSTSRSR